MEIKTFKTELSQNSMTFHAVIFGERTSQKKKINLFGEEKEINFYEITTPENGQKIKITIDISDKTFNIFNKVWDNDFIIDALVFTSQMKTSRKNNLLDDDLVFNIEKISTGEKSDITYHYSYLTVEVNQYKLIKFFEDQFKKTYKNHNIFFQSIDTISIYKDFDKKMIGGVASSPLNRISLYGMGAKLDLEKEVYFEEEKKAWVSYYSIGFVNRGLSIQDIEEKDIEVISIKDYIKRELDLLNNG